MEKEILTPERFLRDYKTMKQQSLKSLFVPMAVLLCISVLIIVIAVRNMTDKGFIIITVLYGSILLFFYYICIGAIISSYRSYQSIKNKRYYVVTDEVVGKQEEERYYSRLLRSFSKPAQIEFRAYGAYVLNTKQAADSSDRFAITDVDNFYAASTGDEFLLVIDKKSQILLIYNTKFFTCPH